MGDYPVGAAATTFEIIEVPAEIEDGGVTEIAERLDLSKGSVTSVNRPHPAS